MSNIVICGFKGAGKTTFGHWLSTQLRCPHIDTDTWIERQTGLPRRKLFLQDDGISFHQAETKLIYELRNYKNHVISLGGGTLCCPMRRHLILHMGVLLYLKVSKDQIRQRVIDFPFSDWERVFDERTSLFESLPVVTVYGE